MTNVETLVREDQVLDAYTRARNQREYYETLRHAAEVEAQRKRDLEPRRKPASGGSGFGFIFLALLTLGGGAALWSISLPVGFVVFMLGVGLLTLAEGP